MRSEEDDGARSIDGRGLLLRVAVGRQSRAKGRRRPIERYRDNQAGHVIGATGDVRQAMRSKLTVVKRGLTHPTQIPGYLLGKLFPASGWGSVVEFRDDFITFRPGGFVQGARSRPAFSAKLYYHVRGLQDAIETFAAPVHRSLEIGCGYGRLTPWIAEYAEKAYATEPNTEALEDAGSQYPAVEFRSDLVQELSFRDDRFDLVVSWTVLQHVGPEDIARATAEIDRVLAPDGVLILTEQTASLDRDNAWGRAESTYEDLFPSLELIESRPKPVEPTLGTHEDGPTARHSADGISHHPHEQIMVFSGR